MGFSRNISDSPIFFSPMIWKILFLLIRTEISKKREAYLIYLGRIDLFFKYVNVSYMVSQKHNLSVRMRVILLSLTWFINIIFSLYGPFLTSAVTEVNPFVSPLCLANQLCRKEIHYFPLMLLWERSPLVHVERFLILINCWSSFIIPMARLN